MLQKLREIRKILRNTYPHNNHFNKCKIFDEILYIFLSWRTPILKAESLFQELKTKYQDFNHFFKLSENEWFEILKSGGKANDKAKTIVKLLKKIKEDFGAVENVEGLSNKGDQEVHEYLISLPGIKDKSAYCIMLYAMKRAFFPADAHCLRICWRSGIIEGTNKKKEDRVRGQKELNDMIRGDYQLCYDLHTTMIQHGKTICKPGKPKCEQCVISNMCNFNIGDTG
jgi:endonuclease-3